MPRPIIPPEPEHPVSDRLIQTMISIFAQIERRETISETEATLVFDNTRECLDELLMYRTMLGIQYAGLSDTIDAAPNVIRFRTRPRLVSPAPDGGHAA